MQIPGFIQSALVIGLVAALHALLSSVYVEIDPLYAPVFAAGITAAIKAIEVWFYGEEQTAGTRSFSAPKSSMRRFLTG